MRLVNWLEVLDPANPSGVLEKLLQKFDTGPSESSESSTFQHFQQAQQHVIFLMRISGGNVHAKCDDGTRWLGYESVY